MPRKRADLRHDIDVTINQINALLAGDKHKHWSYSRYNDGYMIESGYYENVVHVKTLKEVYSCVRSALRALQQTQR